MLEHKRVVLIPGWNEGADGMRLFVDGRRRHPGLKALGFDCAIFSGGTGSLTDRIDQLKAYLDGLNATNSEAPPVALFGYSAGGLIARGLVRAYPECRIAAIFQLATPNAGIDSDRLAGLFHRAHYEKSALEDLDVESPFMQWLNETGGHWENGNDKRDRKWKLDRKPWVMRAGIPILNLIGRMPRYGNISDGVVSIDSATLEGAMPSETIDGNAANHLNLSGTWNPLTLTMRRWLPNDRCWPIAVARAAQFFKTAGLA